MEGDDGRSRRLCQTVAVILLLCSLLQSVTCFSLEGPRKTVQQDKVVGEAAVMEARKGSILFNGKEHNSESGSTSATAATGDNRLQHDDLDQSGGTEMSEQTSQLKEVLPNEAVWRHLNPTLHCGQTQMKLKAMGPGAADLQLDMGTARPLPLIQVPKTCGYSMQQNTLGLVLVVPYDGCNVVQEDELGRTS
ncbi:uncharacterized protein LOC108883498 isoform X2 [Lates calcarifer]|uniref:Uncharacterized protein LOC108883498 isoform X2 n=1 Tax=Lates calcarifer TaxID=8187 RepID=A0AAJ7LW42_LATCA|nr:uncharacterized protein LOC108883498 isoform X2 [Lates calcarifer]